MRSAPHCPDREGDLSHRRRGNRPGEARGDPEGRGGIGGPKRKDLTLDKAAEEFMTWVRANKRPRTARTYGQCVEKVRASLGSRHLSEISPFGLEGGRRADCPEFPNGIHNSAATTYHQGP